MNEDGLVRHRIQFAFTVTYHNLYPSFLELDS
jgi:hypothetical protein